MRVDRREDRLPGRVGDEIGPADSIKPLMDNSIKDRVLESTDIVDVVGERVALVRKGREYVGLCPFHADHNPSMSVSPQKQIFKCWSCGAGGDVIRFIQLIDRVEFREALQTLARRAGLEFRNQPADDASHELRERVLAAVRWAVEHFRKNYIGTQGAAARNYVEGRGLSQETAERFNFGLAIDAWDDLFNASRRAGLAPEVLNQAGLTTTNERGRTYDRFRNRLIFPIADHLGRTIAFGGRTLGDDPAKYLNSPETAVFNKSRVLYALDLARTAISAEHAAIVVEGYTDTVVLHQAGFENVVATLGTALTDAHVALLRRYADRICLCFDGDEAGLRAVDRAAEVALRTQADVRVVVLDAGQDPADCVVSGGPERFADALKGAGDALEFKWSQMLGTYGDGGAQNRRRAVEEYLQFVANVTTAGGVDPVQQTLLVSRLGALLGVGSEQVFDLLNGAKRAARRTARSSSSEQNDIASDYEQSIRPVPAGIVGAMENLLGLLLNDSACWSHVDDNLARAAGLSQTWERLYGVLLDVHEEVGEYSLEDVTSRCDDAALCELVDRARQRVAGGVARDEFVAAYGRLVEELAAQQWGDLRASLRNAQGADESAFDELQRTLRGKEQFLPPDARCSFAKPG